MNAETLKKVLDLPWQIQVVFASGFCGYLAAYFGMRHRHKTADALLISLAFGMVAWAILSVTGKLPTSVQIGLTVLGSVGAGMAWRKAVRPRVSDHLRSSNYSWSDDTHSAWQKLLEEQFTPTQLTVELKDGRYLFCSDTSKVGTLPFGPYVLGAEGDVIMYVDSSERPDGSRETHPLKGDAEWGNLLTWIPKDEVRKISIRLLPKR